VGSLVRLEVRYRGVSRPNDHVENTNKGTYASISVARAGSKITRIRWTLSDTMAWMIVSSVASPGCRKLSNCAGEKSKHVRGWTDKMNETDRSP
jgi:hypothetical protein